jgi:hypothetical protein
MPRRTRPSRFSKARAGVPGRLWILAIAAVVLETAALWLRSHRLGGNVVVRCRRGHLFTTIWIPAASVKSLRLGWWRVQYCPVGRHWTVVTPVDDDTLSEDERRLARERHDIQIP